jgi:hypothetical protein
VRLEVEPIASSADELRSSVLIAGELEDPPRVLKTR